MLVSDLGWTTRNGWHIYPFNFGNASNCVVGEVIILQDVLLNTLMATNGHIQYLWKDDPKEENEPHAQTEHVAGNGIICNISGNNSGHALSEIMSFLNYFLSCDETFDWLAVSSAFADCNKFMFGLLCQFVPRAKIRLLKTGTNYRFDRITLRRNRWFNAVADWRSIRHTRTDGLVHLTSLTYLLEKYQDSPKLIVDLSKKLYSEASSKYNLSKKVLLIKTTDNPLSVTRDRAFYLPKSAKDIALQAGFDIFDFQKIANIEEYICVLHHADIVVFSYGATACTNRFFLKESCTVVLLANSSYKAEYNFKAQDDLWHPLHSHTFPVNRQVIWLDYPDVITDADMEQLMLMVDGLLTE